MAQQKPTLSDYLAEVSAPKLAAQPFNYLSFKMMKSVSLAQEQQLQHDKSRPWLEFFHRFSKNWGGIFGLTIFALLVILALIIPFFTASPTTLNPNKALLSFYTEGYIFGTDKLGRDMWALLWHGLRFSLAIALTVAVIDMVIGVSVGIMMGYYDRFDNVMQFIIKILSNVPTIIIMILAAIVLRPSFWTLVGSLVLTGWIGSANQVRAQVKRARSFEWVKASVVLGTRSIKILMSFVPVIIPILITQLVFSIPGAVLAETALSFIGLSIPNTATLGTLIYDGAQLITLYARYILIPTTLLILFTTSIQLFGNATQDALRRQR